jgi:hypothetical protein
LHEHERRRDDVTIVLSDLANQSRCHFCARKSNTRDRKFCALAINARFCQDVGAVPDTDRLSSSRAPLSEFLEDFPTASRQQVVAALEQAKESRAV